MIVIRRFVLTIWTRISHAFSVQLGLKTSELYTNILRFCKEFQGFEAALAAEAAVLYAAEGRAEIAEQPAVYPDDAGLELCCDTVGAAKVFRPDRSG